MARGTAGRPRLSRPLRLPHRHHQQPHPGRRRRDRDLSLQRPRRRPPAQGNRRRPRVHPALPPARPAGRLPQGPLLRPMACLAPRTAAQPEEPSPAGATCQPTGRARRTRALRRPPGPAIAAPLPALRDRPSDAAAPAVACPAARPVMITMLPTPTPPTPFHLPAVLLSRDPRRSPGAATKSSEIAPRQRRDQPVEWPQRATIGPTLPFHLPPASSHCLHPYPQR